MPTDPRGLRREEKMAPAGMSIGAGLALLVLTLIFGPEWVWPVLGFIAGGMVVGGLWQANPQR